MVDLCFFFFSSRRRHTRSLCDWSSDVCSSDLFMKQQVKKYPQMKLVDVVYGNDDPTVSTQVTQGLLQKHPNLKGIISPTTVRSEERRVGKECRSRWWPDQ